MPHRKIENKDNKTTKIFVSVLKIITLSSQSFYKIIPTASGTSRRIDGTIQR
jgi:hypothetical protein